LTNLLQNEMMMLDKLTSWQPTGTKGSVHTTAYTTVYTITSCPPIDQACQTGVVTTQTIQATAAGTGSGGDSDNAGAHNHAMSALLVVFGALAMSYNVL
jgi:hypothetical protein